MAREAAREDREKREKQEKDEQAKDDEKSKKSGWAARLLSWSVDAIAIVSERADVRCWSTLPGQVLVARLDLPAGRHAVVVEVLDPAATLGIWKLGDVDAIAGREWMARFRLRGHGDAIGSAVLSAPSVACTGGRLLPRWQPVRRAGAPAPIHGLEESGADQSRTSP